MTSMSQDKTDLPTRIVQVCVRAVQKTRSNIVEAGIDPFQQDDLASQAMVLWTENNQHAPIDALNALYLLKMDVVMDVQLHIEMRDAGLLDYYEEPTKVLTDA